MNDYRTMHFCILIFFTIFSYVISETCAREGDVREYEENDLIQVCSDTGGGLQWTFVCVNGWDNQGDSNVNIFCKRSGYLGAQNGNFKNCVFETNGTVKLTSVDCAGGETSLTQCTHSTTTEECELVANVRCRMCSNSGNCPVTRMCTSRSCGCLNTCRNDSFCFDQMCVCQPGFIGESCDNLSVTSNNRENQPISTEVQSTPTTPRTSSRPMGMPPDRDNLQIIPNPDMDSNNINPTPDCFSIDCEKSSYEGFKNLNLILGTSASAVSIIFCASLSIVAIFIGIFWSWNRKKSQRNSVVYSNSRVDPESNRNSTVPNRASIEITESYPEVIERPPTYADSIYEELPLTETLRDNNASNEPRNSHHYLNLPQLSTDQFSIQTEFSFLTPLESAVNYETPNTFETKMTPTEMEENALYLGIEGRKEDEDSIYHVITQSEIAHVRSAQIMEVSILESLKFDNTGSLMTEYVDPPYHLEELENNIREGSFDIPIEKLSILEIVASGNFGVVYRAVFSNKYGEIPVAIKTLKDEANNNTKVSFIREAAILAQFNHPNVLSFIGVVTKTAPYMMITELLKMELKDFLLQLNNTNLIVNEKEKISKLLTRFCKEIAFAMEYLAKKKFIHRDLAARNVLVAKDLTCRLADFGMCRGMRSADYYTSNGGQIPLRWTSPEAILYMKYSEKSDIWAYGVTMYEIWTLGNRPWPNETNNTIVGYILNGQNLPKPTHCSNEIYEIMLDTWKQEAKERPTFSQLIRKLDDSTTKRESVYVIEDIDEVLDESYVEMAN